MEYKKYAIFFGIVLIVAGTIACGGKDTVSEKDRIKDIEVYDDNNELVTLQETEIIMIICYKTCFLHKKCIYSIIPCKYITLVVL